MCAVPAVPTVQVVAVPNEQQADDFYKFSTKNISIATPRCVNDTVNVTLTRSCPRPEVEKFPFPLQILLERGRILYGSLKGLLLLLPPPRLLDASFCWEVVSLDH
jgi:hypothetical protein